MVYFFTIYLKLSEIDVSLLDVERPLSVKPSIFVAFASLLHVGGPHWDPSIAFRVKIGCKKVHEILYLDLKWQFFGGWE